MQQKKITLTKDTHKFEILKLGFAMFAMVDSMIINQQNLLPSHLKSNMDVGIPKLRTLMYDAPWVPWTTGMTLQCSNSTRKSMMYQSMTRHNNTNNAKTLRSSNSTRKCKTFQNITNQIYKERMCYTKKYDEPNMVWTDVLHQKIRRTKYSMNRCAAPKNMMNQI